MRSRSFAVVAAIAAGIVVGAALGPAGMETVGLAAAQRGVPQQVAQVAPTPLTQSERTVVDVARSVSPAVVSVGAGRASGSGVVIRTDGVILTNAHVVGNARTVEIGLADGRRLTGEVLGRDASVDVAVVRIPARDVPVATVGDSDRLEVGQMAIAIGNPLGLERTVTTGIVSAVNRSPRGFELGGLIQTDAAINPGNSGGPLLDSQGRVIGINTVIIGGATGLGFAIPINLAANIAEQVLTTGRIVRAYLGISLGDLNPELARQYGLPVREGIIVLHVEPRTPAAAAGVRVQDIITSIDGEAVRSGGDLRRILRARKPGETIRLTITRPLQNGWQNVETQARLVEVQS
jgi:S1-C subfamily serine protease